MANPAETTTKSDFDDILADPSLAFAAPMDVVRDAAFSDAEKRRILEGWEVDAQELEVASDEGMTGGEPALLQRVQNALRALEANEEAST
jgi:hypothetical protein